MSARQKGERRESQLLQQSDFLTQGIFEGRDFYSIVYQEIHRFTPDFYRLSGAQFDRAQSVLAIQDLQVQLICQAESPIFPPSKCGTVAASYPVFFPFLSP